METQLAPRSQRIQILRECVRFLSSRVLTIISSTFISSWSLKAIFFYHHTTRPSLSATVVDFAKKKKTKEKGRDG
jgi:hypothetical protein